MEAVISIRGTEGEQKVTVSLLEQKNGNDVTEMASIRLENDERDIRKETMEGGRGGWMC